MFFLALLMLFFSIVNAFYPMPILFAIFYSLVKAFHNAFFVEKKTKKNYYLYSLQNNQNLYKIAKKVPDSFRIFFSIL